LQKKILSRIVAIDFGTKRSGIAVTDPMKIIASGLCTVPTSELMDYLKNYIKNESVECIVFGLPKQMNNQDSQSEVHIKEFVTTLQKEMPSMKIERQDERFTSKMAFDTMIASGLKKEKRKDKALIDEISATIILQDYLNKK
jgi:putative Holliday junction resolvase